MPILYADVVALLRPDPAWPQFGNDVFDLEVRDPATAVDAFTVWDRGATTFRQRLPETIEGHAKANALAGVLCVHAPLLVFAARRRRIVGPQAGATEVVVLDGNNRMLALAIRLSRGDECPPCVGFFAAR
jgi:hypothetical protein